MFNAAGPLKPNDNIAPARKGFGFLESGVRHEVQVATCTDQSCDKRRRLELKQCLRLLQIRR